MRTLLLLVLGLSSLAGCSESGPRLVHVKGTVKLSGGQVPQGEVMVIRFEPTGAESPSGPKVAGQGSQLQQRKAAAGDIRPDGTFSLSTNQPGDGAYEGKYKVTFSIWKTYKGHEPLIPKKYEMAGTTPLEATVNDGESNEFNFEIEPK